MQTFLPTLTNHLSLYLPYDTTEAHHLQAILAFLATQTHPFSRTTQQGHITASAVVVDENAAALALIWHEKLGRWLQPGGHCEPDVDATLPQAARRELAEELETLLQTPILLQETPFDVDVHLIPARGTEPAHHHYDIRYLFQVERLAVAAPCQWLSFVDAAALPDPAIRRYAQKLLARYASP